VLKLDEPTGSFAILLDMRVLVTGGNGQLGRELDRVLTAAGDEVHSVGHSELDITDREAVLQMVGAWRPESIIHAAAWTNVDGCEDDPDRAFVVNAWGSRNVAEAARLVGGRVIAVSTDYVFDGAGTGPSGGGPYSEWDAPNPVSAYGRSKLGGEREVLDLLGPDAAVVRTAWVCSAHGKNFMNTMIRLAQQGHETGKPISVVNDQHGSPTFTADLANALRSIAANRLSGVFHAANTGPTTWFDFARAIFAATGHDAGRVVPVSTEELLPKRPAPRPAYSLLSGVALQAAGIGPLPTWQASLDVTLEGMGLLSAST
jgi:dTDP-4-dehydrorhamnose reductase